MRRPPSLHQPAPTCRAASSFCNRVSSLRPWGGRELTASQGLRGTARRRMVYRCQECSPQPHNVAYRLYSKGCSACTARAGHMQCCTARAHLERLGRHQLLKQLRLRGAGQTTANDGKGEGQHHVKLVKGGVGSGSARCRHANVPTLSFLAAPCSNRATPYSDCWPASTEPRCPPAPLTRPCPPTT